VDSQENRTSSFTSMGLNFLSWGLRCEGYRTVLSLSAPAPPFSNMQGLLQIQLTRFPSLSVPHPLPCCSLGILLPQQTMSPTALSLSDCGQKHLPSASAHQRYPFVLLGC
jgi:hypothetical protein